MKVVTVVGARPQFIKAAAVSRAIAEHNDSNPDPQLEEILVHTGQHYDDNMSRVFFEELALPTPDYNLGIGSGSHGRQTGRMLEEIEAVLVKESPDIVMVYGDTNSTLAGALAAVKLHIPVVHVEAGLRSFNRKMPEEINRVLTDHISTYLFCPTNLAVDNLRREGIEGEKIIWVGDVMYDAFIYYSHRQNGQDEFLKKVSVENKSYALATIHRAENTDDFERLSIMFDALLEIAKEVPVVMPIHPRTKNILARKERFCTGLPGIKLIEPVGYLDMLTLENNAKAIITDSGGVQKEAFFARVPCITLRDDTEWAELIDIGWNKLVTPLTTKGIIDAVLLSCQGQIDCSAEDIYGRGNASSLIIKILSNDKGNG